MQNIEDILPPIQSAGLNTQKDVYFGGKVTFAGSIRYPSLVSGVGSSALLASQSGATVLFDRTVGIVYTLPAPVVGLNYDFVVANTVSSGSHVIITDAGTTFLYGAIALGSGTYSLLANGGSSTMVSIRMNGTTTGGLQGSTIRVVCTEATKWAVTGVVAGTGATLATPFQAS